MTYPSQALRHGNTIALRTMTHRSTTRQFLGLLFWFAVCFGASAIGALASIGAGEFYSQLVRPAWAPPGSAFGPVWTILYGLMAVSAWLVWRPDGFERARIPLTLFLLQLPVNAIWSWFFFSWKLGAIALIDVMLLWALIVATLVSFWRHSPLAGLLLVPYLVWVSFAAVLNFFLWIDNPGLLS